jgi:hypothetical protein
MSDPVPAVSEADATGEIAEIFADIRQVLGVGVVNLIWRHLATLPGSLRWVWGALRPLYIDGTIGREAEALRGALELPELPSFPGETLAAAGISDRDVGQIRNVLEAYDRTNAMALIALSAVLSRLHGAHGDATSEFGASGMLAPEPQVAVPLPSLLNLTDMLPATAQLVLTLNDLGARQANPVLASMYRHLALWPPYLALAWTMIAPLDADGRLGRTIDDALAKARARAARVIPRLPLSDAALRPETRAALCEALERFTGDVIAKMVVICALLRKASRAPREKPISE